MKFLLDTNLLIRVEPTSPDNLEEGTETAIELVRLIAESGHQTYAHPASLADLATDRDEQRRALRETLVRKYPQLPSPPRIQAELETELGRPEPGSNDLVDHQLLASVKADAVDYAVTDDHRLVRKARRVGLANRVILPADALATLRGLSKQFGPPPPAVERILAHELDESDSIFATFRQDYPEFDVWLQKCKRSHRPCWIIRREHQLAAVAIVKEESSGEHGLPGRLIKVCSFKVSQVGRGYRYGELLLKPIFDFAFDNSYRHIYLEIFPKYEELIDLLKTFGFQELPARTKKGELVLEKPLVFSDRDVEELTELQFHIRFGPRFLRVREAFAVPIRPRFHDMLFPEHATQPELFEGTSPFGNSILKAYLCHAPSRQLRPGSVLLFYQSGGTAEARCVGVVEETIVSSSPEDLVHFVGKRTVYSLDEIRSMSSTRAVLAILFRQATGVLREPLSLDDLIAGGALTSAPQSITRVRAEGLRWIRDQLERSP